MNKITDQDLANRGVKGLPDVPGLTTEEMQRKLEEIAREILVPKVNEIIENLITANKNIETLNSNLNTANLKLNLGGNVTSVRFATLKASGLGNIRFIYADGSCHLLNITTSGLEYKYVDANGNENTLWSK